MPQTCELTQELDQGPQSNMSERFGTILAHRIRQYAKPRSHRKILVPLRSFATVRSLMMNALRRRNVVNLPIATESITEIEILTRRATRKERRESSDRLERLPP